MYKENKFANGSYVVARRIWKVGISASKDVTEHSLLTRQIFLIGPQTWVEVQGWEGILWLKLGVERVGVPSAESGNFATFAESSCCVALSTLLLALSAKIIQKVTINSALYQLVPLF